MSKFIKFTNIIVNTSKIIKIETFPNKYHMHISNKKIDGWIIFSSGAVETIDDFIEICQTEHPLDYHILSEWIRKI
jgi:hypothetical protein